MLACISGCRGVIGFNVATSQLPVREKFALRTKNGPKSAFYGVLGELFREYAAGRVTLGELIRARYGKGRHSDGFFVEKSRFLSRNDDVCNAGCSQAPRPGPGQPRLQRPKRKRPPTRHAGAGGNSGMQVA